jgi:hypothetical protein
MMKRGAYVQRRLWHEGRRDSMKGLEHSRDINHIMKANHRVRQSLYAMFHVQYGTGNGQLLTATCKTADAFRQHRTITGRNFRQSVMAIGVSNVYYNLVNVLNLNFSTINDSGRRHRCIFTRPKQIKVRLRNA